MQNAVELTRELLRFDTVNPPGRERDCAQMAGRRRHFWHPLARLQLHRTRRRAEVD
jgi:hypothetical protein